MKAGVFVQAFSFGITPLLSRLYDPIQFGSLALFTTIVSVFLSFSTFRFDWLMPNARTKTEASGLFVLGLSSLIIFVGILYGIILTNSSEILVNLVNNRNESNFSLEGIVYFLPIALLGIGIVNLLKGWYVYENDLSVVSKSMMMQSSSRGLFGFIGGIFGLSDVGLVSAYTSSLWVASIVLARNAFDLWKAIKRLSLRRLNNLLWKFNKEASWSTIVSFINTASLSLPLVLISSKYSIKEAGWYSLMYSFGAAPINLLTSSLSQSYWAHAAELYNFNYYAKLNDHYLATTRKLFNGAILIIPFCLLAPLLIGPVLGKDQWTGAGYVMLAMTPMFVGNLVFSPTNHLVVLKKQSKQLFADVTRIILIIISILTSSVLGWNSYIAILLASISSLLGHLIIFILHLYEHEKLIN